MKDEEKSENYSDDFFDRVKQAKEQAAQDQQNRNKMQKKKFIADQKRSNAYGDTKPKPVVKKKQQKLTKQQLDMQRMNDKEKAYQKSGRQPLMNITNPNYQSQTPDMIRSKVIKKYKKNPRRNKATDIAIGEG
jgi:hypothetical protein